MFKAFLDAWQDACKSGGTVLIVDGTYRVNTVQFAGPCKGEVKFMVNAVLQAPQGKTDINYWISFKNMNGLTIQGNGTFDGQGRSAWPSIGCKGEPKCTPLSTVS